jgi:DNA-binding NtrC family response regulator
VTHPEQALGLGHFPNRIREVALLHATGHYRPHGYREALERFRREYAAQVLSFAGGDMRHAAKLAGVNPSTLHRLGGRSPGE